MGRENLRLGAYLIWIGVAFLLACGSDEAEPNANDDAPLDAPADGTSVVPNEDADIDGLDEQGITDDSSTIEPSNTSEGSVSNTASAGTLKFTPLAESGDVVSFVDLQRYLGTWYEVATTPSFQQAACTNTQAQYTFNEEQGWVDVLNSCRAGSAEGRLQEIRGHAELVDTDTQAKLAVVFFNQRSPYWVVSLDGSEGAAPYQWAVVSVPGSQTIWILARTPQITEAARQEINDHLENRGFPIERLIDTPQVR